jgi:hypothetical protein
MRIGGGNESWMVLVPLVVAGALMVVALGGPDRALFVVERAAEHAWTALAEFLP